MHEIGVFTTIKVIDGIPLHFDKHKKRLIAHAKKLNLSIPDFSQQTIYNYLKKNKLANCALRITIQNGLSIKHRLLPEEKKIKVITFDDTRNNLKIFKTTDRIINDKARQLAVENGADDALFILDNNIIESTYANVFSFDEHGNIITPPIKGKGLQGIARQVIMENIHVKEMPITKDINQPLVLVNSLRVQPVTEINGKSLPDANRLAKKLRSILFKTVNYQKISTWIDPENVFELLLAKEINSFWLDTSLTKSGTNRFSYMGGSPSKIYSYFLEKNRLIIEGLSETTEISQDIFSFLEEILKSKQVLLNKSLPFDFIGGFIGYFGYELKALTGGMQKYTSPYPDSLWFYVENVIVFDHQEKEIYLVSLADDKKWLQASKKLLQQLSLHEFDSGSSKHYEEKTMLNQVQHGNSTKDFVLSRSHKQYIKDISTCKEYLQRGDSYQVCLTNTFTTKQEVDPLALYKTVRKNNPAPYAVFLKYKNLAILSSSPEQFLTINKDRIVETKPIKGTIRRGKNQIEDKQLIEALTTNDKEWSENAMIVDLLRNDLGKVCVFGSINVKKLMDLESFATVHHLVSTIQGTLRDDVTNIDCIKACFPGGSMTGVPKIRTMEIIDELENTARGIYSGTIGFLSLTGTAKLNIAIRNIIINNEYISIGAGGAIVMQSDPKKEFEEMVLKAQILMQSISETLKAKKVKVFFALGSNIGNKKINIKNAIALLAEHVDTISVGNFIKSAPMYFEDQEIFTNTVLSGHTTLSPDALLLFIKQIEKRLGRKKRFKNGPREIDIDILFYDNLVYNNNQLQIPHPKMQEREFVLKPFMDLEPDFFHPLLKKTMRQLYNELKNK
jgi:aminodeoxychorismate synthase component I/2-amino-4-hydroxy-6-hydroxymethyldihydropteridine diphosphokinase